MCVDVAKNELHILTVDCSITGSLLFLFKDDGVCQEAAEMPRDIICFSCLEQVRWSPCWCGKFVNRLSTALSSDVTGPFISRFQQWQARDRVSRLSNPKESNSHLFLAFISSFWCFCPGQFWDVIMRPTFLRFLFPLRPGSCHPSYSRFSPASRFQGIETHRKS